MAVSDADGTIALPAGHLLRSKLGEDIHQVLNVVREREIQGIVVGIPYNIDGALGPQARRAQGFMRALQRRTDLPIYPVDERFTTFEAEALLREAGQEPSRQRGAVDAAAAALILRRFLDQDKT